jgi:hypothetical protein
MEDQADDGSLASKDDGGTRTHLCTCIMIQYRITDDCQWANIMAQGPLPQRICIFGSAATVLSERRLMHSSPDWSPHDLDVFESSLSVDFDSMVAMLVHRHSTICETSIVRRRCRYDVIDVTTSNSQHAPSFIKLPPMSSAGDVVQKFNTGNCTPIIVDEDALRVKMPQEVASSIRNRSMRSVVRRITPSHIIVALSISEDDESCAQISISITCLHSRDIRSSNSRRYPRER